MDDISVDGVQDHVIHVLDMVEVLNVLVDYIDLEEIVSFLHLLRKKDYEVGIFKINSV